MFIWNYLIFSLADIKSSVKKGEQVVTLVYLKFYLITIVLPFLYASTNNWFVTSTIF